MSSVPPPPPGSFFPPPPPPPGAVPAGTIPWESQPIGLNSFIETAKLFITVPAEAWRRTPGKGDMFKPLLFSVILGWIGAIFQGVYGLFFSNAWMARSNELMNNVPPQFRRFFMLFFGPGGTVISMILAPIVVAIALFISAAVLHVCFMIVGALSSSTAGFEGTFRVVAYSGVANLARLVPFVGALLYSIWYVVLVVMGAVALHRTTQGKAIMGVLLPLILCCGCVALLMAFGAAALFSGFKR
jgi:hypothetical protein